MKKLLLLLFLTAMVSSMVFAEEPYMVLVEYFSWINCPYCPTSRLALIQMEEEIANDPSLATYRNKYLIIKSMRADGQYNLPQSPGHTDRCNLYNNAGVPAAKINGVVNPGGISGTQSAAYAALKPKILASIDSLSVAGSPFKLDTTISLNDDGYITIDAHVEVLRTSNLYGGTRTETVDFANSRVFMGVKLNTIEHIWEIMAFDINGQELGISTVGQTANFTFTSTYRPVFPLSDYSGFSFIQRYVQENINNTPTWTFPRVYQSSVANFDQDFAYFTIESVIGYAPFTAHFNSLSYFPNTPPANLKYEWNYGVNDTWVIPAPDPYVASTTYSTPNTYTVSLRVTKYDRDYTEGGAVEVGTPLEYIRENAITVMGIPPARQLWGELRGLTITAGGDPWTFIGDATLPYPEVLTIEPGAVIHFNSGVKLTATGNINVMADGGAPTLFTLAPGQTGTWGGIELIRYMTTNHQAVTIKNAIFEKSASAISASYRDLIIEDCIFRDNRSAPPHEIAPALYMIRVSNAQITRCVFMNNYKGAIGLETSNVTFKNCLIVNNTGNNSGGLFTRFKSTVTIDNCTIYNNHREGTIGGTILSAGSSSNPVTMWIKNSIIEGNPPIFFSDATGKANIYNSNYIKWSGTDIASDYPTARFSMNDVIYKASNYDESGNWIPLFVNPSAGAGYTYPTAPEDWILAEGSIAIDAGKPLQHPYPGGVSGNNTLWNPMYADAEDITNGRALYPARGEIQTDLGAYGGTVAYVPAPPMYTVTGTVSYGPNPVPFANVTFTNVDPTQYSPQPVQCNDEGEFTLETRQGTYIVTVSFVVSSETITFEHTSHITVVQGVDTDPVLVVVPLPPPLFTITGVVSYGDEDESVPITSGTVTFTNATGGGWSPSAPAILNGDGEYSIEVRSGSYRVRVQGTLDDETIDYTMDEPYEVLTTSENTLDILISPSFVPVFTISGVVKFGYAGTLQSGAIITLTNVDPDGYAPASTTSLSDGTFAIYAQAGTYVVMAAISHLGQPYTYTGVLIVDGDMPGQIFHISPLGDGDTVFIPSATALGANYPNPFNPTTTIAFDLARTGQVSIEVYNVSGQRVKTLTNRSYPGGRHTVVWYGDDQNGRAVGSGVYFYRMTADGYTKTQKMLLMK